MGLFSRSNLKIDPQLFSDLSEAAEASGYSSADEMAEHILRKALEKDSGSDPSEEERKLAEDQLKGLGYLK